MMRKPNRRHPLKAGLYPLLLVPKVDTRNDTNDTVQR
jgi:hypothetical protein